MTRCFLSDITWKESPKKSPEEHNFVNNIRFAMSVFRTLNTIHVKVFNFIHGLYDTDQQILPKWIGKLFITLTYICNWMLSIMAQWKVFFFSDENLLYFPYLCSNIDCGSLLEPPQWGGSSKQPQSMFWTINKKNHNCLCKPHFFLYKVWFKRVPLAWVVNLMPVYLLYFSVCCFEL